MLGARAKLAGFVDVDAATLEPDASAALNVPARVPARPATPAPENCEVPGNWDDGFQVFPLKDEEGGTLGCKGNLPSSMVCWGRTKSLFPVSVLSEEAGETAWCCCWKARARFDPARDRGCSPPVNGYACSFRSVVSCCSCSRERLWMLGAG